MPVNTRVLKWIVIILGILIVIGVGGIIYVISSRLVAMAEKKEAARKEQAALVERPIPVEPSWAMTGGVLFPEEVAIALEAGENVSAAQMVPQGLLLTITRGGETTALLLVGPDGALRSRFVIRRPE